VAASSCDYNIHEHTATAHLHCYKYDH